MAIIELSGLDSWVWVTPDAALTTSISLIGHADSWVWSTPSAQVEVTNLTLTPFIMRQFPFGAYFDRSAGWLPRVSRGMARFLSRLVRRRTTMERQIDPRTATELIGDWERALGLTTDTTLDDSTRRDAIMTKLRSLGGVTADYYTGLAVLFGYGDAVVTDAADPFECDMDCDAELAGGEWKVTFFLTATSKSAAQNAMLRRLITSQMLAGWNVIFVLS